MKRGCKNLKKRKGFTMVELMVVIIIMAILGLAVIPSLMGSSDKAKYSRAWSDLTAISNAFTAFYGRMGNLPTIADGALEATGTMTGSYTIDGKTVTAAALLQSFLGTSLDEIKDPWGNSYMIKGDWDATDGNGYIIVYVDPKSTASAKATFGTNIFATAKADPYNDNMPMAKLVINVPE